MGLVIDKHLSGKRAELALGAVEIDAGSALAHFAVREIDSRRNQFRDFGRLYHHPTSRFGGFWFFSHNFGFGCQIIPFVTIGMSLKGPRR